MAGGDRNGSDREAALRWASDERRLLPEENPRSEFVDDALHWVKVYMELLRLKADMIAVTERQRDEIPKEGRPEVDLDLELLKVHAGRLEKRLEFWRLRGLELQRRQ